MTSIRNVRVLTLLTLTGAVGLANHAQATSTSSSSPTPLVAASCAAPENLNGLWQGDDGSVYAFRQIGTQIWGVGRSQDGQSWTTVFNGVQKGLLITGKWVDVDGKRRSNGTVTFQGDKDYRFSDLKRTSSTGGFTGMRWIANCDDVPNNPDKLKLFK
ncbi:hypothetical protein [Deinococcus sp. Leaf326]|jgi:hypothetical protein|uniref:hypothetical protein n=1 Tax=Deinococcus sp. Leaf326 TaxID=1736338 RepID=UPI000A7665BA|nr:hypothetical protein [Deinococcus sp. Leaf326]